MEGDRADGGRTRFHIICSYLQSDFDLISVNQLLSALASTLSNNISLQITPSRIILLDLHENILIIFENWAKQKSLEITCGWDLMLIFYVK
jgi:hypothetical protein